MGMILELEQIQKYYGNEGNITKALGGISFAVEEGEFLGIMGASGSGKTTLLNCISTIDTVSAGHIYLYGQQIGETGEQTEETGEQTEGTGQQAGETGIRTEKNQVSDGRTAQRIDITQMKAKELARFRRENLGFVFQDFNLLDTLSLRDNIYLPLVLAGTGHKEMENRIKPLADRLAIPDILEKYPYEVSGGQRQRAAACRALITNPDIILADEPTGALDSRASGKLLKLFGEVNREGQTILMVTHSIQAASHAGRVLFIKDGSVFHQIYKGNQSNEEMYKMISDALTVLQRTAASDGAKALSEGGEA